MTTYICKSSLCSLSCHPRITLEVESLESRIDVGIENAIGLLYRFFATDSGLGYLYQTKILSIKNKLT